MINPTEIQIEKIAKHSYENGRLATDTTAWDEVSKDTRASYINEAKEQYEYLIDMLSVLGAPPDNVERLTKNLSINMENSAKLMLENAELKTKLDQRNESIRELKEKLTPLINENKILKEERDALKYELNTAVESAKATPETEKTKEQPINKKDTLDTPPSVNEHITYVYDVLNQSNSLKDGKIALCKALKIEPKNLRSKTKLWISIRIKQCGWDAVNKACNTINQA